MVEGEIKADATTYGDYVVIGSFDADHYTFTLTGPPVASEAYTGRHSASQPVTHRLERQGAAGRNCAAFSKESWQLVVVECWAPALDRESLM